MRIEIQIIGFVQSYLDLHFLEEFKDGHVY